MSATKSVIDKASFQSSGGRTVWLKGFLNPKKTSQFELSIQRISYSYYNYDIIMLYVSSDASPDNKQLIAKKSSLTDSPNGVVNLVANN